MCSCVYCQINTQLKVCLSLFSAAVKLLEGLREEQWASSSLLYCVLVDDVHVLLKLQTVC